MTSFFILTIVVFKIPYVQLTFKLMVEVDSNQVKNVHKSCSYMMSKLITSNKQSLFKHYGAWMTTFRQIHILFFPQRFKCYTIIIVKELLYNKKSNFYFYFKKCCNSEKYNRNQHIKLHNKIIL